jgi:hypothetical protein
MGDRQALFIYRSSSKVKAENWYSWLLRRLAQVLREPETMGGVRMRQNGQRGPERWRLRVEIALFLMQCNPGAVDLQVPRTLLHAATFGWQMPADTGGYDY